MHKLRETRLLPYSHKDLFDLVMDVESYPKFLPFCVGAVVLSPQTKEAKLSTDLVSSGHLPALPGLLSNNSGAQGRNVGLDSRSQLAGSLAWDDITAELTIKFGLFTKSYRSLVTSHCDDVAAIIEAKAISGPFKYLSNLWKFTPVDQSTLIEFYLDFELESLLLDKMLGSALDRAYSYMIEAFEKRAQQIYGKNTSS
jgi:coenzyme Q-binding protein COQ10